MNNIFNNYLEKIDPRLWAVTVSLMISFILGCQFYINVDGILYLTTADSFLNAHSLIPPVGAKWPFYPLLIAGLSSITGFSAQTSALIWQALFMALLVTSFINIIRVLGGNRVIQHLAAAVILLHPDLNDNRNMIIRDFGYWAFLFTSFYYLLRYLDKPSWLIALIWTVYMVIAVLFRIEGVVIIALAPLLIFFMPNKNFTGRLLQTTRLYSILVICGLLAVSFIFWKNREISLSLLGRIDELPRWWQHLTVTFFTQWENVRDAINALFPQMKNPHVTIFMLGGLIVYVIYRLINTMGLAFIGLTIYGQSRHALQPMVNKPHRCVLYGFLAINFLITIVFVTHGWFLAGRYLIATTIILLLWVPFTLVLIYQQWQQTSYHLRFPKLGKTLAIIIAIALFVDCYISFGPSHKFVKESAEWIQTHVPENATLYSNSAQLAYYSNRPGTDWYVTPAIKPLPAVLADKSWKNYAYVALYINRKDKKLLNEVPTIFPYPPLAEFSNSHGDKIEIYKVQK